MAVPVSALTRPATRIRRKREDEEDPESLLSKVGRPVLGGLAAVGNLLDVPGSMVRDVLGGENPFDQFLSPLSSENRVTGRELLERGGLLQRNQKGFDLGDVAGFAGEVLLDPLTYLGGVGLLKSASKGGATLARAGLKLPSSRVARMTTKVSEAASKLPTASLEDAAKGMGYADTAEFLSRHGDEPLGGLLSLNKPFGGPVKALGTGPLAQKVGRGLDVLGEKIGMSPIGREAKRMFSPAVRGGRTAFEQLLGRKTHAGREEAEQFADALTQKIHDDITRTAPEFRTPGGMDELRAQLEQVYDSAAEGGFAFDVPKQQFVGDMQGALDYVHKRAIAAGKDSGDLVDEFVRYFPRGKHGPIFDAHEIARQGHLRDWPGGTNPIRDVMRDPELHQLIDSGASNKTVEKFLREKYGNPIAPDSPLALDSMVDDVLDEQMQLWNEPFRVGERQFRQKYQNLIRRIHAGADIDQLPGADELGLKYREATGIDATNEEAFEALMRTDPKPSRTSVKAEAEARIGQRVQELPFDEQVNELAPSNEFVVRDQYGRPKLDREGNPLHGNRWREVAKTAREMTKEQREAGLFRMDPLDDFYRYVSGTMRGAVVGESTIEAIRSPDFMRTAVATTPEELAGAVPLRQVLRNPASAAARETGAKFPQIDMGLNPNTVARQALGIDEAAYAKHSALIDSLKGKSKKTLAEKEALKRAREFVKGADKSAAELLNTPVKKHTADAMVRMSRFGTDPKERGLLQKLWLWHNNLWKGTQTSPWAAFHGRNFIGANVQNVMAGLLRPTKVLSENRNAYSLMTGKAISDAHTIPVIQQMLSERGLEATAENGTQMLRELAATHRVWDSKHAMGWGTDVIGGTEGTADLPLDELLARQPGRNPLFGGNNPLAEIGGRYIGQRGGTTLNPLKAEMRGGWTGAERSTFGPLAGGELAGAWIEGQNRLPAFMDQLRQGVEPGVAAKRVAEAQVDYSARNFTDTERAIKQVVPFYSFGSRMAKFVASEIANRPGGPMAQVIKAQGRASGEDENLPPYLRGSMSIPLGESATGDKRFLTGLGLMHEGSFLNLPTSVGGIPSLGETGAQLLASTTPLIKGPLEAVTGESFFQRTPLGGRELESMDPLVGGTIANVQQLMGGERQYPAEPFLGQGLEQFLTNTPASRALSTVRTLTDVRKLGPEMASEMLTGIRLTDISRQQQERILRERLAAAMKQAGAPQFSSIRFTKQQIDAAKPNEAEQMRLFNSVANQLQRQQAKARAERKGEPSAVRLRRRPVSVVQ